MLYVWGDARILPCDASQTQFRLLGSLGNFLANRKAGLFLPQEYPELRGWAAGLGMLVLVPVSMIPDVPRWCNHANLLFVCSGYEFCLSDCSGTRGDRAGLGGATGKGQCL